MERNNIQITVKTDEFPFLEDYLIEQIGERFSSDFKVIHRNDEQGWMNVEILLEDGIACFLLGGALERCPIGNYIKGLKN